MTHAIKPSFFEFPFT